MCARQVPVTYNLEASSRMLQEVCNNIKTAIEQGRTYIIRSVLETCEIIFIVLLFLCIAITVLLVVQD
jgi:hypothetical protein